MPSLWKRAALVYKTHKRMKLISIALTFTMCLIIRHYSSTRNSLSGKVMIIYTKGSYRGSPGHERPKTFDDMLKLLRWYNAGDLVWQYAASSLIDTTRMHMCRTDTVDCVTFASEFKIKSLMYRPEANLLAEEGTFESRREIMDSVTEDILSRGIPILFIGIGTQGEFSKSIETRDLDSTGSIQLFAEDYNMSVEGKRMLSKLEQMKMPVLTRGKFSAQVARRSGMSRAVSCGCPSLLINEDVNMGRHLAERYESLKNRENDSILRVAINVKPKLTKLLEKYLKLGERYPNSIFFAQESNDVRILQEKGVPFHRIHVSMSYEGWKDRLCGMDVSVGSRIHGSMAALGCPRPVPAIVIAADHRVLELSQEMHLPHVTIYDQKLQFDEWFGRVLSQVQFNGELFDRNRCEKANNYVRVFEQFMIKPSSKLRKLAASCV